MMMTRWAYEDALGEEYRGAWEASGVTCSFQNAGEEGNDPVQMLGRLAHYTHLTDCKRDFVARAPFVDDITAAKAAGKHVSDFCHGLLCLTMSRGRSELQIQRDREVEEFAHPARRYRVKLRRS